MVLRNKYFTFENEIFPQIFGTAVRTKMTLLIYHVFPSKSITLNSVHIFMFCTGTLYFYTDK